MKFFDIVGMSEGMDNALSARLGYYKVFALGKEIVIRPKPEQSSVKQIVMSKDIPTLLKAIKDQKVIGIAFEDNEIIGKALAAARDAEKPLIINLNCIFASGPPDRYRNIGRIKGLIKAATAAKCRIAIISGAKNADYMISPIQVIEIAKFLGMDEEKAKRSLSSIGEHLDS